VSTPTLRHPYINSFSDEHVPHKLMFRWHATSRGLRLDYTDLVEQDRVYGVLWACHGQQMTGRPQFKTVNTARQRRSMRYQLCQVCAAPAADPDTGRLWMLLTDEPFTAATGERFTHLPPTCRDCIPVALRHCPRLRRWHVLYTAASYEPYAVQADIYRPGHDLSAVMVKREVTVELDRFRALDHALAKQLLVALDDLELCERL
jgi:hypothetical protein